MQDTGTFPTATMGLLECISKRVLLSKEALTRPHPPLISIMLPVMPILVIVRLQSKEWGWGGGNQVVFKYFEMTKKGGRGQWHHFEYERLLILRTVVLAMAPQMM